MTSIVDPITLKPADVYRQACVVNAKTSRGHDRGWSQDPVDLNFQWHLWFDGGSEVVSATFSRVDSRWKKGPPLPLSILTSGQGVEDILSRLLDPAHFGQRPNALGVILHVADEFALSEVAHKGNVAGATDQDFAILHFNLIDDPQEFLVDREGAVEATSWRLLPFWGAGTEEEPCTAISLSRSREVFLRNLLQLGEQWRTPIRVSVTAAPLEAFAALPLLSPALAGGRLIAVTYLKFTTVFALTQLGELRSMRTLLHRGNAPTPAGFGDVLWNMALSAELTNPGRTRGEPPKVLLLAANPVALQAARKDLEAYSYTRNPIRLELLDLTKQSLLQEIPHFRPEFLVYDNTLIKQGLSGTSALAKSRTFTTLWNAWLRGFNFFNFAKLDLNYPTLQDLRLLKAAKWIVRGAVILLLGASIHCALLIIETIRNPAWTLTEQELNQSVDAQTAIQTERNKINVTNTLMQSRSRGWVALEFLLQLFPENSAIILETFQYSVETTQPTTPTPDGQAVPSAGMVRTWIIKGVGMPKSLECLNKLSTSRGVTAFFKNIAISTGDYSYNPDNSRQITATQNQGRNPKFNANAGVFELTHDISVSFPIHFEATITQIISEKDTLAFPTKTPL